MVSTFQGDRDFSVEDKPRSGQPKKFEDKELEALFEKDQSQTQGAYRIIGSNSTSRFCTIESHGKSHDSKTKKLGAL